MARATVITDASFCPHTGAAGWAAWVNVNHPDGSHERIKRAGLFHDKLRNSSEAEKWACYNGIWLAVNAGAVLILVQTDLKSLVEQRPKCYARTKEEHWPEAQISWRHVKAHTAGNDRRTWVNNWCDEQAKKHMKQQRKTYGKRVH